MQSERFLIDGGVKPAGGSCGADMLSGSQAPSTVYAILVRPSLSSWAATNCGWPRTSGTAEADLAAILA
jgi:hypothetical protein